MSHGDGPPPFFEGEDFPYWKIHMESYLEAIDVGVLRSASQGLPKPKDPKNLTLSEQDHEKWNAKAKTPSLEAFARMTLTMCETTRTPMHYGRAFMRSMRELRVSVRNGSILS